MGGTEKAKEYLQQLHDWIWQNYCDFWVPMNTVYYKILGETALRFMPKPQF
jgi:hypothetical protein